MSVTVTSTEFKTKLGYYLDLLSQGVVVFITRNGKITGKLVNANASSVDALSGLLKGVVSDDLNRHNIKESRFEKKESID